MNSLQFKKNEFKKFCSSIKLKRKDVEEITARIDDHYNEWTETKINKTTGEVKRYQNGTLKKRTISPPKKKLKAIQRNIKSNILSTIDLPNCVHGGVKGRSNITNAKLHQGKKYQLTTDLQDFFPRITSKQVYNSLIKRGLSTHYSSWITKLTTWKYKLPQGAPTSTHISNLVFFETDLRLIELCKKHEITYSRYIDDLTFSSQQDFSGLIPELMQIIKNEDFKINYRKTNYKGNQNITGLEVYLNKIDAPDNIIEKAISEFDSNSSNKPYLNYLSNIRRTNTQSDRSKQID